MSAPAKHHFITSNFLICSLLNCAKAHVGGEPHGCIATGLVRSSSSSVRSVRSAGHAFRLHKMGGGVAYQQSTIFGCLRCRMNCPSTDSVPKALDQDKTARTCKNSPLFLIPEERTFCTTWSHSTNQVLGGAGLIGSMVASTVYIYVLCLSHYQ